MHLGTVPGVDEHELRSGVDYNWREWQRNGARRLVRGRKRLLDFGLGLILHEFIGQRQRHHSVGDHADLEVADLVAIKAGSLLVSRWCCGCLLYTSPSPRD